MAPPGAIVVHVYARSDVGRAREHNEDSFVVADLTLGERVPLEGVDVRRPSDRGTLFMVADGMGGAAAGEIASEMAVEAVLQQLRHSWSEADTNDPVVFVLALREATEFANVAINRYATDHPELRGMGTTATIAGLVGDVLYLAQVGDSRAYLVRSGVAWQITKDQSLMQKLIEAGEISAEEAEQSDRRNIILQALGPENTVKIDLTHQPVRRGDVLILCSDGLSALVRPDLIARAVAEEPDLEALCERLIDTANAAGGPDNITVVVARFDGSGLDLPGRDDQVGHQAFGNLGTVTPSDVPSVDATTPHHMVIDDEPPADIFVAEEPPPAPTLAPPPVALPVDPERQRKGRLYVSLLAATGVLLAGWLLWEFFIRL